MTSRLYERRLRGFTLTEMLVVIAILAVLSGIVYAAAGGVREKSRQAVCISNLHQIGMALAMYRQDYGGSDAPGWPTQMGLPPNHVTLGDSVRPGGARYLSADPRIFFCPDFRPEEEPTGLRLASSYGWIPWGPNVQRNVPGLPPFPEEVARRGQDMPIVYCNHHDFPPPDRPHNTWFVIVLRLDGHVTLTHSPTADSWLW